MFYRRQLFELLSLNKVLSFAGVQNSAGQYLSKGNSGTPRKGKIFHAAGARISLSQPTTSSADEVAIEGPTTASLRVVVS